MRFVIKTGIFFLNMLYCIFKCMPVQNKVVYISRQMDDIPIDFKLLKQEMEEKYPEYSNVILAKTIKKGLLGKIKYCFHMLRQMYHIATARAVVLDTYCILISVLEHRKKLVVIQMWHALGAFKKFGYSILDKEEGTSSQFASLMKMHNNYSYVFASSEYCKPFFAEAFQQPLEKIKIFPLPRVDLILSDEYKEEKRREIFFSYPELLSKEKKIIVYAPTFRKKSKEEKNGIQNLIKAIEQTEYTLVLKLHPLMKEQYNGSKVICDRQFSTFDMFLVADYIITDYSAVIFEGMLLEKPLYLYAYDYNKYQEKRDFYLDYEKDFQGLIYKNAEDIIENIENSLYDAEKVEKLRKMMIRDRHTSYTKEICEFLVDCCESKEKEEK